MMALIVNTLGLSLIGIIMAAAGIMLRRSADSHAEHRREQNLALSPMLVVGGVITLLMGLTFLFLAVFIHWPHQFPSMAGAVLATLFAPYLVPLLFAWLARGRAEKAVYPY
ncbi:hypothetical protein M3A96_08345 [Helcobacillus massiliensis]|uniref:Putative membrane protein n=1 Tax=Helcobacillus massiliensis TaxID=521392 RepID=A0A839R2A7_9MICO|nr:MULTISPECIES: hypothetical protein [Helcobacillus]MBB3022896.1 putative membrane protein [Helcobacillus massiliensis]MCT1558121.1 hypothetical protein [Helcobacillus massiliensis]MCT2037182.1 hypothetical protein [Helcobacillus massiliensis]MCT2332860.1 hypothetical protein [Helcobacillus massiliensis]MDK7741686.1 hypothetical protein [Helcobacillus massiliensis]